jgi:hypothetical protein
VASYNPWVALHWLTTGRTLGGLPLYPAANRLDRHTALALWTKGSAWFSREEDKKGAIKVGEYADIAVLSDDYFTVAPEAIKGITSVLTIVDGRIVHGAGPFRELAPPLPPASPDWSPVRAHGGAPHAPVAAAAAEACACDHACAVHGHAHHPVAAAPTTDLAGFWGALGCACFAF